VVPAQALDPHDPQRLGPYRLLGRLGAGGMGEVFLGEDPRDGRRVAIKTMHQHIARMPGLRERFRREVEAAGRIRGEFTAPVLEARTDDPRPWFALAYVEGPTLLAAVADHGPLPEGSVRALAVSLCEALTAVHAAGLVHRDLKPSNVILSADGPRLIDFGIAALLDRTRITHTGQHPATAGYAAPEYLERGTVSPAADVFSLGCVLVWAASAHPPFTGPTPDAVNLAVLRDEPDVSGVPDGLVHVLWQCLEKDPDDRLTLRQLLGMLRGVAAARGSAWLPDEVRWEVASATGADEAEAENESEGPTTAPGGPSAPAEPGEPPAPPAPRALHDLTTADGPREAAPAYDPIAELNARLQESRELRERRRRQLARGRIEAAYDAEVSEAHSDSPTGEPGPEPAPRPKAGWAPRVVTALVVLGLVTGVAYGLRSLSSGGGSGGSGDKDSPGAVHAGAASLPGLPQPRFRKGALGTSQLNSGTGDPQRRFTVTGATAKGYELTVRLHSTGSPFHDVGGIGALDNLCVMVDGPHGQTYRLGSYDMAYPTSSTTGAYSASFRVPLIYNGTYKVLPACDTHQANEVPLGTSAIKSVGVSSADEGGVVVLAAHRDSHRALTLTLAAGVGVSADNACLTTAHGHQLPDGELQKAAHLPTGFPTGTLTFSNSPSGASFREQCNLTGSHPVYYGSKVRVS
jgi:hypothetical protein